MKSNTFKVVDLFCGLGGLTTGVIEACNDASVELDIVLANDIEDSCAHFYKSNFSEYLSNFYNKSIDELLADFNVFNIEKNSIDLVLAGPPCQGNSDLNNKTRRTDSKNILYLRTIDFIAKTLPKYFLIENVPSVIHAEQNVVDESLKQLINLGYNVFDKIVEFGKLGVAQNRKRHILIGERPNKNSIDSFLDLAYLNYNKTALEDVIGDLLNKKSTSIFDTPSKMGTQNIQRVEYLFTKNLYDLPNQMRPKCHQKIHSYKSMYGRMHWHQPSQTITGGFGSMGQGRFIHPLKKRVITPHEAARIQGLPDWLNFESITTRTKIQKMIGNAVPPVLSKEFVNAILKGNNCD
ncbi:MAG: DNA cytosine methyltransferase [Cognaticolwellia sp.]